MLLNHLYSFLKSYTLGITLLVVGALLKWGVGYPAIGTVILVFSVVALARAFKSCELTVSAARAKQMKATRKELFEPMHYN
ncbi:MAG: hypothetical protein AAF798_07210 [Bacteroidota bacterium]